MILGTGHVDAAVEFSTSGVAILQHNTYESELAIHRSLHQQDSPFTQVTWHMARIPRAQVSYPRYDSNNMLEPAQAICLCWKCNLLALANIRVPVMCL